MFVLLKWQSLKSCEKADMSSLATPQWSCRSSKVEILHPIDIFSIGKNLRQLCEASQYNIYHTFNCTVPHSRTTFITFSYVGFETSRTISKFIYIQTGCLKIKPALGYLTIVSTSDSQEHFRGPNRF